MKKEDARKQGLTMRNALSSETREVKSILIFNQLKPYIQKAHTVGCYISMRTEVNTYPILQYCLELNKKLCVPVIRNKKLYFMTLNSLSSLHDAPFHTREPDQGEIVSVDQIDLMIVPLSSFDNEYNRTGYGKGYYDSVLNHCTFKAGIAFKEQKVDYIETDPWDVKLDTVIYA